MRFAILHISDLHRDRGNEVRTGWLLDSLERDFTQFSHQDPQIMIPALCVVSGDLVYGISPGTSDVEGELKRQYGQTKEFLVGLADQFFNGNRERIVILPGNHDVCFDNVIKSVQKIEIPTQQETKARLVAELFAPNSQLRWSWQDLCFFKIINAEQYRDRFRYFATMYEGFYEGERTYPLAPEMQLDVFDFHDLDFCVIALNSCFNNDPFRRAGAFHPETITSACRGLRQAHRSGWLAAAAWHHNLAGGPIQDDYLDLGFLQLFIDAGVSLAFHGHQHLPDCIEERYRLSPDTRKMTIISASTLCAAPSRLKPGVPRSYNIVELDTDEWHGRVHQRQMVNMQFSLPVWGPGHFIDTNSSFHDFELCKPIVSRPSQLDEQLVLERADRLLGFRKWAEVLDVLAEIKKVPMARPLLRKALQELDDTRRTITTLWPPESEAEVVMIGGAILENGTPTEAENFMQLSFVRDNEDASVREIARRVRERWLL